MEAAVTAAAAAHEALSATLWCDISCEDEEDTMHLREIKYALDCKATDEVESLVDAMAEGDVMILGNTRVFKGETKTENEPEMAESKASLADLFVNDEVKSLVGATAEGDVMILENTRAYDGETKNEQELAESMASLADLVVGDAFGAALRAHTSTESVTKFLKPCVSGFSRQEGHDYLKGALGEPKRPVAAIVGGAKVSTKIPVIESKPAPNWHDISFEDEAEYEAQYFGEGADDVENDSYSEGSIESAAHLVRAEWLQQCFSGDPARCCALLRSFIEQLDEDVSNSPEGQRLVQAAKEVGRLYGANSNG